MSYWFCNCIHKSTGMTILRLHNNLIIFIGQVFHAEKMLSKENVFHKKCFTCLECKRPLDSTLCNDSPDGEIFCRYSKLTWTGNLFLIMIEQIMQTFVKTFSLFYRLCYGKNFGPKGYGFGGAGSVPALMSGDLGQFAEDRVP